MSITSTPERPADAAPAPLVERAAQSLAATETTASDVMTALGAQGVERHRQRVRFTVADGRFARVELALDRTDPDRRPPESITFYVDSAGPPLQLQELARVFGNWTLSAPGFDVRELYSVQFDTAYRSARALLARRVEVRVFAVLATAPAADAHVTEVVLRRDVWD